MMKKPKPYTGDRRESQDSELSKLRDPNRVKRRIHEDELIDLVKKIDARIADLKIITEIGDLIRQIIEFETKLNIVRTDITNQKIEHLHSLISESDIKYSDLDNLVSDYRNGSVTIIGKIYSNRKNDEKNYSESQILKESSDDHKQKLPDDYFDEFFGTDGE